MCRLVFNMDGVALCAPLIFKEEKNVALGVSFGVGVPVPSLMPLLVSDQLEGVVGELRAF